MGQLDQVAALRWVQANIAQFGGDPDRVTIMGESAGSASVTYHMLSDLSQPFFTQAIAESGSALSSWAFDTEPEKHAKEIVGTHLGCPTDNIADMVNCVKYQTDLKDLVVAHKKYYVGTTGSASSGITFIVFTLETGERKRQDGLRRLQSLCSDSRSGQVHRESS